MPCRSSAVTATFATTPSSSGFATPEALRASKAWQSFESQQRLEGGTPMIDFELSEAAQNLKAMVHGAAEAFMRPVSRQFDEEEHTIPWDFINFMWQTTQGSDTNLAARKPSKEGGPAPERNLQLAVS